MIKPRPPVEVPPPEAHAEDEGGDEEAISNYKSWSNGGFAAIAGYPHITIPLDYVDSLPVGVSFIGRAWDDKKLIEMAFAFEQRNEFYPKPIIE